MIFNEEINMSESKQEQAIKAIDSMLQNLKKPKLIAYKDIVSFYQKLEENYDDYVDEMELFLSQEVTDEEKFKQLKKISNLLEMNIF